MFKGSCVALITPFTEDGVNYEELRKLLEWHIKNHTDAILVCGTTGRFYYDFRRKERSYKILCGSCK